MKHPILILLGSLFLASCVQSDMTREADRPPVRCGTQLTRTVEARLPDLGEPVEPRALSCMGLTQLYFLLTSREETAEDWLIRRQRLRQVFRNEGQID